MFERESLHVTEHRLHSLCSRSTGVGVPPGQYFCNAAHLEGEIYVTDF
jgi:hypothetical protein